MCASLLTVFTGCVLQQPSAGRTRSEQGSDSVTSSRARYLTCVAPLTLLLFSPSACVRGSHQARYFVPSVCVCVCVQCAPAHFSSQQVFHPLQCLETSQRANSNPAVAASSPAKIFPTNCRWLEYKRPLRPARCQQQRLALCHMVHTVWFLHRRAESFSEISFSRQMNLLMNLIMQ